MCGLYKCETCGKEYNDYDLSKRCEARHFGLTVGDLNYYNRLKYSANFKSIVHDCSKSEDSERELKHALDELAEFEKYHNIKSSI